MSYIRNSLLAGLSAILGTSVLAQDYGRAEIQAPPTAPPLIKGGKAPMPDRAADGGGQFLIGDPTDEEQLFLELMNRARKDASAEAARILSLNTDEVTSALLQYQVDTNLMISQFSIIPPAMPLSFNSKLITAARGHSQYQLDNGIQTHVEGTKTLVDRLNAVSYSYSFGAENVFAYSTDVEFGHAGFEVDWGTGVGGMQTPAGHRSNIHNINMSEVGVGIVHGTNTVAPNPTVGPMLVTEDFGKPATAVTYVTGVAYYDLNGNGFYDLGEGLGGVTVTVDGNAYFAVTTASGGYSVPVTPNQSYTVRFNVPGATEKAVAVSVGPSNVKVDFTPSFVTTAVTSAPATVFVGASNEVRFAALPGATGYRARFFKSATAPVEGAETLTNVTITATPGYLTTSGITVASGTHSFRLAHVTETGANGSFADPQYVQFKTPYYVKAGGKVSLQSLLALSYLGETAKVQVSKDDGATWTTVYSRSGNTTSTFDSSFAAVNIDLSAFAGQVVLVRLNYDINLPLGWYSANSDQIGWYVDSITFTNVEQLTSKLETSLDASGVFGFDPPTAGNYQLQIQAISGARTFPWGPIYSATAQALTVPVLTMNSVVYSGRLVTVNFTRTSGTTTAYAIDSAASINGPWSREADAVVSGPVNGNQYSASVAAAGTIRFYRAVAN